MEAIANFRGCLARKWRAKLRCFLPPEGAMQINWWRVNGVVVAIAFSIFVWVLLAIVALRAT